jgi:RNA polymerase sigma-70 factor (ECF subfamily)
MANTGYPSPNRDHLNDRELLDGLREGSEEAFEAIFRTHYAALVRFGESILGDRAQGEEAAQDVMLELWRRRDSITVESSLQAYLFRATRNRALNSIRHDRIVQREEANVASIMVPVASSDRRVLQSEIDIAVRDAIETLPPRCRDVFKLSRYNGLTYAEIASTLEISVKTVEAQMGKALRVLRGRLAPFVEGTE